MSTAINTECLSGQGKGITHPSSLARRSTQAELAKQAKSTKITTGVGLGAALGLGFAMKDGLNEGLKRIGNLGETLSSLFAIPATFLTPVGLAYGEYEEHKEKGLGEKSSSRLLEIVYPVLSVAFAPMTAFHPLKKATESKLHLTTTLINMPHILFTFFSYTGGRFLTLLRSFRLLSKNLSEEEKLKDENERKILSDLGDIGSDNAGVTPGAHQFATGIQTILSVLRGDFSSVKDKFKEEPVTTFLGTFLSSVFWIPIFVGKSFDTVIRTLEMTDRLENAVSQDSNLFKTAVKMKNWWHKEAASNSLLGRTLSSGRNFGKISQAIASPMGMISVVFPVFDHFFKHGFNSEEARELNGSLGNTVRGVGKVLNIGAFLGHCYFTTLYGLFVRLPQTIVTSTFYICKTLNNLRGVKDSQDPRYLDARKVRDRIFNPKQGLVKSISDFAANKLEKLTGKRTMYDSIYKVLADEECYKPLREKLFKEERGKEYKYKVFNKVTNKVEERLKKSGEIPPNNLWSQVLKDNKEQIIQDARVRFRNYLIETMKLDEKYEDIFFSKVYNKIENELKIIIEDEIQKYSGNTINEAEVDKKQKSEKPKLQSKDFFDMITHPFKYWGDIKEVFKFKTTLAQFVYSPLNLLEFVHMIEMGNEKEELPEEIVEKLLQESSIRNGDFKAGNKGEMMPVYLHAVQTAEQGLARIAGLVA